jgi:hypothetical protein
MRIPDVVPALGRHTRPRPGRSSALDAADERVLAPVSACG